MATPSADSSPARRPTSLDDLPRELKALVVNIAASQVCRYHKRSSTRAEIEAEGRCIDGEWEGRSLDALRLVKREWKSLADAEVYAVRQRQLFAFSTADPHRYRVCPLGAVTRTSSLSTSSLTTGHSSARPTSSRRMHSREDHTSLLRSLHQIPNLDGLLFDAEPFYSLFGGSAPSDQEQLFRRSLLRIAPTIRRVHLVHLSFASLLWALPAFTHLRTLYLDLHFANIHAVLRAAVGTMAELRELRE